MQVPNFGSCWIRRFCWVSIKKEWMKTYFVYISFGNSLLRVHLRTAKHSTVAMFTAVHFR